MLNTVHRLWAGWAGYNGILQLYTVPFNPVQSRSVPSRPVRFLSDHNTAHAWCRWWKLNQTTIHRNPLILTVLFPQWKIIVCKQNAQCWYLSRIKAALFCLHCLLFNRKNSLKYATSIEDNLLHARNAKFIKIKFQIWYLIFINSAFPNQIKNLIMINSAIPNQV